MSTSNQTQRLTLELGTSTEVHMMLEGLGSQTSIGNTYEIKYNGGPNQQTNFATPVVTRPNIIDAPIINATTKTITFQALNIGETSVSISYTRIDNNIQYEESISFRVCVHKKLTSFWILNSRITLFANENIDVAQLRIGAEFDNGLFPPTLGLISGAPYVDLEFDSAYLSVINNKVIKAVASTLPSSGPATTITAKIGGVVPNGNSSIPIYVQPALTPASRPVLKRVHRGNRPALDKLNWLVIGEGFTDPIELRQYITEFSSFITSNASAQPFNLAADFIDIWYADWLSNDTQAGVTIHNPINALNFPFSTSVYDLNNIASLNVVHNNQGGLNKSVPVGRNPTTTDYYLPSLVDKVGLPRLDSPTTLAAAITEWQTWLDGTQITQLQNAPADVFTSWRNLAPSFFSFAKDTVYGFVKGNIDSREAGSYPSNLFDNIGSNADFQWFKNFNQFQSSVNQNLVYASPDILRASEANQDAFHLRFDKIIKSLVSDPTETEVLDGRVWGIDSQSSVPGLITVIIKDETYGGISFVSNTHLAGKVFVTTFSTGAGFHRRTSNQTVSNIAISNSVSSNNNGRSIQRLNFENATHETGHGFGLYDEYGGGASLNVNSAERINAYPNVCTIEHLRSLSKIILTEDYMLQPSNPDPARRFSTEYQGTILYPEKIKWNYNRVEFASLISSVSSSNTEFTIIASNTHANDINLNPKRYIYKVNDTVIIRKRSLNFGEIFVKGIITVATISQNSIELRVNITTPVPSGVTFGAGDVLYKPLLQPNSGVILQAIAQSVKTYLSVTKFKLHDKPCSSISDQEDLLPPTDVFRNWKEEMKILKDLNVNVNKPPLTVSSSVIGVYEGGAGINCNTFHASGRSKMRREGKPYIPPPVNGSYRLEVSSAPYDFVSRFYIVNKINPILLSALDTQYI